MEQATYKNCVLIGFMGCGKTTIAKSLKRYAKMNIVDMDKKIEQTEGMKVSEIFETYGEEHFRRLETSLLIELQSESNTVVSCGGGVPLREENRSEMRKIGPVIWLNTSPEIIFERVKRNDKRPILRGNMNIEFIKKLMSERKDAYRASCDILINTEGKGIKQICYEILKQLEL